MEPEKTEQSGSIEPPSVGDMDQGSNRRGSVRLNTFETMLDPAEIVSTLTTVRTGSRYDLDIYLVVFFHALNRVVSASTSVLPVPVTWHVATDNPREPLRIAGRCCSIFSIHRAARRL